MAPWSLLERLAARQHGVVAAWQVVRFGKARSTFVDHVRRHGWTRLAHGVWGAPWSPECFARRCQVARLGGPRARLVAGGAVLVLVGARRLTPSAVELWTGPGLAVARRPGVRVHRGAWVTGDRVLRVEGMPCTPVLRSLRDAAAESTPDRLARDIAALDRLRLASLDGAAAYLDRCGRFPGRPKLVAALEECGGVLVHSAAEARARQLLGPTGVPLHPRPLAVGDGRRIYGEIDLAVCRLRYGAEIDGPSHREDGAAELDRARDRKLRRLGWHIDRFPDELLCDDPRGFVAAVRAGLAAAAARDVEPWPCTSCPR